MRALQVLFEQQGKTDRLTAQIALPPDRRTSPPGRNEEKRPARTKLWVLYQASSGRA